MEIILWKERLAELSILKHWVKVLIKSFHEQRQFIYGHIKTKHSESMTQIISPNWVETLLSEDPKSID